MGRSKVLGMVLPGMLLLSSDLGLVGSEEDMRYVVRCPQRAHQIVGCLLRGSPEIGNAWLLVLRLRVLIFSSEVSPS